MYNPEMAIETGQNSENTATIIATDLRSMFAALSEKHESGLLEQLDRYVAGYHTSELEEYVDECTRMERARLNVLLPDCPEVIAAAYARDNALYRVCEVLLRHFA